MLLAPLVALPILLVPPYAEVLLPPDDEDELTDMMECGRLFVRKSSVGETVIELRNRGAALYEKG